MSSLRSLALAPCLVVVGLACDTFEGTPGAPDGGAGDGGPVGDAASGCATLYVSSDTGLDANSGCSPTQPKRTITSALAAAKERKTEVQEVHVCKGDYGEPDLTLDQRVSLRGGYACSDFTREQNFGAAGAWKYANPTTVFNSKTQGATAALSVTGTDVGNGIEIDGFVLRSAVDSTNLAMALSVENASPYVHDCAMRAKGTTGGGGVVGARLSGTSVRFTKNLVEVVGGGTEDTGGIGLVASSGGTVTVEASSFDVHGGRGRLTGSAGIYAGGVVLKATGNFVVVAGEPTVAGTDYTQSVGITVANATGSFLRSNNAIAVGGGCTTSPKCLVSGVAIGASSAVEVSGNRVMVAGGPATNATNTLMGVSLALADRAVLANNAVLNDATASTAISGSRTGLSVQASSNVTAVGNSIVFSRSPRMGTFSEVNIGVAIYGSPNSSPPQSGGFAFYRNLIAMLDEDVNPGQRYDFGVLATTCPGNGVASNQNNVIVGFSTTATSGHARYAATSGCSLESSVTTFTDTLPGDTAGAARYTCTGGATPAKCVEGLFLGFNRNDWAATLFDDKLKLATTAPCVLAKGGGSVVPELGFDLLGKARAQPFTPGAYERDGCAPPDP